MPPTYVEAPVEPSLRGVVRCVWWQRPAAARDQRVVPDGCADLIWMAGELTIAGPDRGPRIAPLAEGDEVLGIRLRAGAAGGVLGVPMTELADRQVRADEVLGDDAWAAAERLAAGAGRSALEDLVRARGAVPDPLVQAAAWQLTRPRARIADVAAALGVGERRLHRHVTAAVGYGPKVLARVARLERLRHLRDEPSLARRALAAGYASQSHMADEVRRLTGLTAAGFLEEVDGSSDGPPRHEAEAVRFPEDADGPRA